MKNTYSLPVLFLFAMFWMLPPVMADGLAGPNQETCKETGFAPNSFGNAKPVKLGVSNAPGGLCYYWSPQTGLSDPHSPNPMASPGETTTYTLTVVYPNFSKEDAYSVTVTVNVLNDFTVTPHCCYRAGQTLTIKDFDITTDPPGLEHMINLSPSQADKSSFIPLVSQSTQTITFTSDCSNLVRTANITVIDDRVIKSISATLPTKYDWVKTFGKITENAEKWFQFIQGKIPLPAGIAPCAPAVPETSLDASYSEQENCCGSTACIVTGDKFQVSYKSCFKGQCDFPVAGIPFLASVNVRIKADICLAPNVSMEEKCESEGKKFCFNVPTEVQLSGGASVTAYGGAALDASLLFIAKITPPVLKVCNKPEIKIFVDGSLCFQVDVAAEIKLISLIKIKNSVTIIPKQCKTLF